MNGIITSFGLVALLAAFAHGYYVPCQVDEYIVYARVTDLSGTIYWIQIDANLNEKFTHIDEKIVGKLGPLSLIQYIFHGVPVTDKATTTLGDVVTAADVKRGKGGNQSLLSGLVGGNAAGTGLLGGIGNAQGSGLLGIL